ncbi:MAG TPA: M1 family metallopeptidase [Gemmatimonadales bacterium]|nr:M1 family metallopeptidase [Gemmatimonadales bacterium]
MSILRTSHPGSGRRPLQFFLCATLIWATAAAAQQPATAAPPPPVPPSTADTSPFRQLDLGPVNVYRTASGVPGPSYWQQRADYNIRVSLDTATHTIRGEETLAYTNNSPDTLRYLWMQVDMNIGAPDNRMAPLANPNARQEEGFQAGATIERLNVVRGPAARTTKAPLTYRMNSTMMRVDLDRPLPPKGVVRLDIAWHHQIPRQGRTGRTRQGDLGWLYQVAQWYPRMAVYDDVRGWNTDQYIGSGEFYLEYGNFDVAITMPAGFTVTATGLLQNSAEVLPALLRTRLAAAAKSDTIVRIIRPDEVGSAALLPARVGATRTWRWHADNVRDFAWATAPNYLWDASSWSGILMQAFYPPSQLGTWQDAADMTRHSVMLHSRWFHYPYPSAVSAQGPVGGMEYPMMTFDDADSPKELYYTIAHEQGHEWYPMIVGSNERLYPWMDEGFNTFIDYFSFRDRYPDDTSRVKSLEFGDMGSWQQFLARRGPEEPIMVPQDREPNGLMSGWNAYGRPAVGLHFLRNQVVDSTAFDQAFAEYTRRWAFKHPTPADFFRSMNDGLGEDLSWFWRSWFYRTDHLDQAIDSVKVTTTNGQDLVRVFLSNRGDMVAPVALQVTFANGTTRSVKLPVETWFRGDNATWAFRAPASPALSGIEIDPAHVYPEVERSDNVWTAPTGP